MKHDHAVIFGAAVWPHGEPSGSLRRRVDGALAWWRRHPAVRFMPTGGIGRHGPAEAVVMEELLLAAGVPRDRIVPEDRARDTLESVRLCDRLLRERGDVGRILPCTSGYHQPRCAMLFAMLGYRVVLPPMPSDRAGLSRRQYARLAGKEVVAAPYDAALLLFRKATGRRDA